MPTPLASCTVGLCGAGQMGAAAAVCFRRAGYRTLLWIRDAGKVGAVTQIIADLEAWTQQHLGAPAAEPGPLQIVTDLSAIDAQADVVIDCIAEVLAEKAQLFGSLAGARRRGALFLTTTSGLSITELGRRSETGRLVVGTHFWNPPHLMPLVEVIRGEDTDDEAMDRAVELVESIGKIAVRVERDVPGFIGNRLLHAMWREALSLVQNGVASAADIDRVARLTFGLRMPAVGPLENIDLVGLPLVRAIHQYLLADLAADRQPLPVLCDHIANGELGMTSGRGFYDWRQRAPQELIERRDRQIVRQLAFLRELNDL